MMLVLMKAVRAPAISSGWLSAGLFEPALRAVASVRLETTVVAGAGRRRLGTDIAALVQTPKYSCLKMSLDWTAAG